MPIFQLSDELVFPPTYLAEDGLLAIGGDLSTERLLLAYQNGIFPWFNEGEPILWWAPDPRCVIFPEELKVSKSLKQTLRKGIYSVTFDQEFESVISNCQKAPRKGQDGTWITEDIIRAYTTLHELGYAHSVEVWNQEKELVGGLYGISLGKMFFGESMFAKANDASKVGLYELTQRLISWNFDLIDCQVHNAHLESLGAQMVEGEWFIQKLNDSLRNKAKIGKWS